MVNDEWPVLVNNFGYDENSLKNFNDKNTG